jgi:hypothetical protein
MAMPPDFDPRITTLVPSSIAVRTGIAQSTHFRLECGDAGLWGRTGKWIGPGPLARSPQGIGIGSIAPVPVEVAFRHGALFDENAKRPTAQCAVG